MGKSHSGWLYVIIAGALEIVWASGLKYEAVPAIAVIVALILTFDLLIKAARLLPVGTMYAVFAGIGTVGTVIVESVLSGEIELTKIVLIFMLLTCVVGLKLTSDKESS